MGRKWIYFRSLIIWGFSTPHTLEKSFHVSVHPHLILWWGCQIFEQQKPSLSKYKVPLQHYQIIPQKIYIISPEKHSSSAKKKKNAMLLLSSSSPTVLPASTSCHKCSLVPITPLICLNVFSLCMSRNICRNTVCKCKYRASQGMGEESIAYVWAPAEGLYRAECFWFVVFASKLFSPERREMRFDNREGK